MLARAGGPVTGQAESDSESSVTGRGGGDCRRVSAGVIGRNHR